MRVLVIGERYPDSFADNLTTALLDDGHDARCVEPYPCDRRKLPRIQARIRAALVAAPEMAAKLQHHVLDAAHGHRPELIVNLDYRLSYAAIPRLRVAASAPVVFWFPDSPGNLGRETHVLAGYDALFFKDSAVVERYRKTLGLPAFFLPEACNPRWHRPPAGRDGTGDGTVLIAGNVNATRFRLIGALVDRGLHVVVHGPQWARWLPRDPVVRSRWSGRYLTRVDKAIAFGAASVVLNPLSVHEGDGMNCRLFEAAACGAVILTERRGRLAEQFAVPGEVRAYTDLDELVDRARELTALPAAERLALGDRASARALRDHTYARRFAAIRQAVGLA